LGNEVDIRVISNIYPVDDQQKFAGPDEREGAIFVGNVCHNPNVDAIRIIMHEILHDFTSFPPNFKMHLVVSRTSLCPHPLLKEAEKHPLVVIHRDISNDELFTLHEKVKVVLAPLRFGAGVKGKVNYGLLNGVPVIATKIASEGMGLVNEKSFLFAETGSEFQAAILRLYSDKELFQTLVKGGREIMKEMFGRDVAMKRIREAFVDLKHPVNSYPVIVTNNNSNNNNNNSNSNSSSNGTSQKVSTTVCSYLDVFESHQIEGWNSYWYSEINVNDTDRLHYFPLFPRLPFTNPAYIQYVKD
jgi:hypothetical protein